MNLSKKDRSSKDSIVNETHNFGLILETRDIFLHSYTESEEDHGIDYRSATRFLKNIKILEKISDKPINIHQHSIGGCWEAGMVIFDAIKYCTAFTTVYTYGIAASMGSIIPQAASHRVTMPRCSWLIHEGFTSLSPSLTLKQAQSQFNWEQNITSEMYDIYATRCSDSDFFINKTKEEVTDFLKEKLNSKEDWWLSSEEAIKYGFCDIIYNVH